MQDGESPEDFWTRSLRDFATVSDRQFPALACERVVAAAPGTVSALSRTLTLAVPWKRLEDAALQIPLQSVASIFRAAFAQILAEYLESDRVILGELRSNGGDLTKYEQLTLVPVILPAEITTRTLASQVDSFVTTAATIDDALPPNLLRELLQCTTSKAPYNALFVYAKDAASTDLAEKTRDLSEAGVALQVLPEKDGLVSCTLFVREDLMDIPHVELFLQQIDALISTMVSRPTEPMQNLAQFFPEHLLSTHTPVVSRQLRNAFHLAPTHWVDYWAQSKPSWPALETIESLDPPEPVTRRWTYGELAETSNRICTWLARRGWRNRVIADDLVADLHPPEGCTVFNIDDDHLVEEIEDMHETSAVEADETDHCYLLYTSGSTGLPKGVLVGRGNLSAFTEALSEYICRDVPDTLRLGGQGAYIAHASRAFDVHVGEMVLAWRHGLRLVTAPRTVILDNLRQVLRLFRITHAGFVPSLLEQAALCAEDLPDLRFLAVGGEKISETIIERFVGKPNLVLVNAYGPTEVTIGMTIHTVTPKSTVRNIGRAIGNSTIHVLEPDSTRYVKRGQAGELCVTGDLVANGYHRRPDAKGFTDFHGQRMYRTGDIVRLMANDCVEYLGRRDSQAKVRGQRLELEEVSIAVRRCAERSVNVASMITPSPVTKRPQLVTFISPSGGRPEGLATKLEFLRTEYQQWVPEILERCRERLPVYMVPSVLLIVNFIPMQISGKTDNRRLVALYESIPAADLLLEAPALTPNNTLHQPDTEAEALTRDEEQVLDILCSLLSLGRNTITKTTNFFQLGIDSLGSVSLAARIRESGYVCSAADILTNPTLAKLAALLRSRRGQDGHEHFDSEERAVAASQQLGRLDRSFRGVDKAIANSSIAVVWPCIPLQESLVSSSMGNPTPLYVMHIMFRLGPNVLLGALKAGFEDLIHETEILRTCFAVSDDRIVQVVLKPRAVKTPWEQVAISDEKEARVYFSKAQVRVAASIVNNIESKPPLRIIAASSTADNVPGIQLFLDRLYHHYTGNTPIQVIDHAPLYGRFVSGPEKGAEEFWSDYLSNFAPSIVKTNSADGDSPFKLSRLATRASELCTTSSMVLETIWGVALARLLGQADVLFGRVMNGRGIPVQSVERMLVPLVTTVPGRLQLPSMSRSLVELIQGYSRAALGSSRYQHTPPRTIQRYARASGPLYNSMISYIATGPLSPADAFLVEVDTVMPADYPLALEIRADSRSDTVTLRLRVSSDPDTVEKGRKIIDTITDILRALLDGKDVLIDNSGLSQRQERNSQKWDEGQWSESERETRKILSDITTIPETNISKNISFFAIGVDSVIAIRLARRLQEQGLRATSSDIMRYPSIGALHHHLELDKPELDKPGPSVTLQPEEADADLSLDVDLFDPEDYIKLYCGEPSPVSSFAPVACKIACTQESSVRFWAETVKGYRHPGLPASQHSREVNAVYLAETKVQIPMSTLQAQCNALEVTPQTVALLAFGRSLATLFGQRDVVFGLVVSGRGQLDDAAAPVIGPLFNTVPMRIRLQSTSETTRSVLRRIQRFTADAQPFQHAPLRLIQRAWRSETQNTSPGLFDAIFSFNKQDTPGQKSIFQPYISDRVPDIAHYPLNIEFEQAPGGLVIRTSCRGLLGSHDALSEWLKSLARGIENTVNYPDAQAAGFPAKLSDLPLSASPPQVHRGKRNGMSAPRSELAVVKDVIAAVAQLPLAKLHENTSIFALGVDSILAIDISAKCRSAGINLAVSDILRGMTIEGIAMIAAEKQVESTDVTTGSPTPVSSVAGEHLDALAILSLSEEDVESVSPCLSGQLFYISSWLRSQRQLWEYTFAFRSVRRLDPDRLRRAWLELQRRHDALRTSFAAVSADEVVQVVYKPSKANSELVVVLNDHPADQAQHVVEGLVHDIAARPSDLFNPPVRLHLVRHKDIDTVLLTLQHALYDAWTIQILLQDLESLYLNKPLPAPGSFSSFVQHVQQISDSKEHLETYWRPKLASSQPTLLGSNTFEKEPSPELCSSQRVYSQQVTELEIRSRQMGITLPSVLLLAAGRTLARTANVTHPTFGLFQSGRSSDYPDILNTAGPTVNMLPLVITDALAPLPHPEEACAAIQRDLSKRALYDQTNLQALRRAMKEHGTDLLFNVILNIILAKPRKDPPSDGLDDSANSIFDPLPLSTSDWISAEQSSSNGKTSVDAWDYCSWLPCERNVYLEVGYDRATDALYWRVDYTLGTLSRDEAEELLRSVEGELDYVLGCAG
ncbi:putative nonribosomal peptide synthase [Aspergillus egyptiacus]|nr:putative nonribosomal peptide synthase [Aspergillus egyptiacus]